MSRMVQPTHPDATHATALEFYLSDCTEGMKHLPEESVDIVVTSPPYNLGIAYSKYRDNEVREDYLDWCREWTAQVARVLKPSGAFFLNLGACPSNPYLPHELVVQLRDTFRLQNTFHWIKSISIELEGGDVFSKGHFKPINSERFVNDCHEYLFHLTKTGSVKVDRKAIGVPYMDKSNITRWGHTGGSDKRCRGNNWFVPYKTINSRNKERPHPATFPAELAEKCILIHGGANISDMVVLDPFVGIGSAAAAAEKLNVRRFIGFDIDPEYLGVAAEAHKTDVQTQLFSA